MSCFSMKDSISQLSTLSLHQFSKKQSTMWFFQLPRFSPGCIIPQLNGFFCSHLMNRWLIYWSNQFDTSSFVLSVVRNVDYFTSPKIKSTKRLYHDCAHGLFFLVADRQAGRTIVFANYKPTLTQAPIIELIVGPATKTEVQRYAKTTTTTKKNPKKPTYYYNSIITNLKFQHKPKYHLSKILI